MERWKNRLTEYVADCRIFKILKKHNESPLSGKNRDFFVIEAPHWVNVVAITPEQKVILVRQYRHGTDAVTLEVPAGSMDEHDENALETARRELKEETGYESSDWTLLGICHPNPATQNNRCYIYLANNCSLTSKQQLDEYEEIEVELVNLNKISEMIQSAKITHTLAITSFYYFELHQGNRSA